MGTPNVGKTSLVNTLAGSRLDVGNWPGTTLEVRTARARLEGAEVTLVDLPGAYVLAGAAEEEEALLPALNTDPDALIVNVVDATNLARDLTLTLELTELGRPMVVALNLVDQAAARGLHVDAGRLEERLGVPVIAVRAHVGAGAAALPAAAARARSPSVRVPYPEAIAAAADRLNARTTSRWHALAALTEEFPVPVPAPTPVPVPAPPTPAAAPGPGDTGAAPAVSTDPHAAVRAERGALAATGVDPFLGVAEARHRMAHGLAAHATRGAAPREGASERIDRALLHPVAGPVLLLAGLALTFHFTFALSDPWVTFLGTVQEVLAAWVVALPLPALVGSFLAGALIEGVGTVVAFVPVLFTLYAILGFLENAGVLARIAYLADGLMRAIGLPGRAVLPMVLSLGCTVPAIQSTRMLDARGDRLRLALALPSIPCGARLPVFVLLAGAFVPRYAALVMTGLYLLGFAVAILSALFFKHLLRTEEGVGAMELPDYRLPPVRMVLRLAWVRTRAFLASAGGPILVAVAAVWALLTFELPGGASMFETVSRALAPLFAPLGLNDWRIVGALIPGMVAKEVVIGSLALTFTGGEATVALGPLAGLQAIGSGLLEAVQGTFSALWGLPLAAEVDGGTLGPRLSAAVGTGGALALMVFTLLYVPCVATLAAIRKAFGARHAALSVAYQLSVAYLAAWGVFQLVR